MSEYYYIVVPATESKEVAEDILKHIKAAGWAAHITKSETEEGL